MKAIEFKKVSKVYRKGPTSTPTLRDWVDFIATKRFQFGKSQFYALKEISFSVRQGAVVGFIGSNGAGKSTILKLISKVTYPTKGRIRTKGSIAGLLELGAGFHHELTGRENIFFKAAILGMSKTIVREKLDKIIAFSGLEEFIDTPIKYYSSGMQARLGFSVAIHANPNIFLIDEVLSVGDAAFREKCVERVKDFCKDKQKTVVMVSHNLTHMKKLCQKVYWLEHGQVIAAGPPQSVISAYIKTATK